MKEKIHFYLLAPKRPPQSHLILKREHKMFEGDVTYYFNGDKTTYPVDWFVDGTMLNYYKTAKGYVHDQDCFDGTLSHLTFFSSLA